ncbi:unnamed protein product [Ranitomeya imitator]|uniref:Uncharacterized protein n=1 Tax=Ranitomeya imitator TaxID=111125 RepID=A0ABN9MGT3_9NEOB|nr:unnamed protein product [Ranitomeya imitator]
MQRAHAPEPVLQFEKPAPAVRTERLPEPNSDSGQYQRWRTGLSSPALSSYRGVPLVTAQYIAYIRGFLVRRKLQWVHQEYLEVVREIEGEDIALNPGNCLLSIPQFITLDRTSKPSRGEQKRKDDPIETLDTTDDISFIIQKTKSERKDSFPDTVSPKIHNYVTQTDAPVRESCYIETDAPGLMLQYERPAIQRLILQYEKAAIQGLMLQYERPAIQRLMLQYERPAIQGLMLQYERPAIQGLMLQYERPDIQIT